MLLMLPMLLLVLLRGREVDAYLGLFHLELELWLGVVGVEGEHRDLQELVA